MKIMIIALALSVAVFSLEFLLHSFNIQASCLVSKMEHLKTLKLLFSLMLSSLLCYTLRKMGFQKHNKHAQICEEGCEGGHQCYLNLNKQHQIIGVRLLPNVQHPCYILAFWLISWCIFCCISF